MANVRFSSDKSIEIKEVAMRKGSMRKSIVIAIAVLLTVIFSALLTACSLFNSTPEPSSDNKYNLSIDDWYFEVLQSTGAKTAFGRLDYYGDYYFDEFLSEGADSSSELFEFLQEQFPNVNAPISLGAFGCSTFASSTTDGDVIFGRNFDYMTYSPALVVRTPSREGVYATIAVCGVGFLGYNASNLQTTFDEETSGYLLAPYVPLDGINERGLTIAVLALTNNPITQRNGKTDITTTTAIRLVLDYAATVDEAVSLLNQYDLHTDNVAYHFQIADAQGNSAIVEYTKSGDMAVTYPTESYQYCTNHYYGSNADLPFYDNSDSERRAGILDDKLSDIDGVFDDETEAMKLLKKAARANTTANSGTHWSAVYNLTERTVEICLSTDYDTIYSFSFLQIDS